MNRKERRFASKQSKTAGGGAPVSAATGELAAVAGQHLQAGRLTEAEALYRQILAAHPTHIDSLHLLGGIAHQTGRHELAVELIGKAIAINGRIPAFHSNLAAVLRTLGRLDEAIAACRRALALKPDFALAHLNLGIMHAGQGRHREALASYLRAIALKHDSAELHNSIGNVLQELGKLDDAAAAYRRAIARQPSGADAHNNLGNALQRLGRFDEAVAAYRQAISLRLDFAEAYYQLGNALKEQGKTTEAMAAYRQTLALQPDYPAALAQHFPAALAQLAHLRARACDWSDSERETEQLRAAIREHSQAVPPFGFLARPTTAAEQLLCAQRWVEGWDAGTASEFSHQRPTSARKIRLGYLSADFREHPVGHLIAGLIERHDRSRFDVFAYSYGPENDSETRRRISAAFDRFSDVRSLADAETARQINADGIDIAIDLNGHTEHQRTRLLALRPAPIQVNFLGYPGTLGAGFIDYIIADAFVVPPDQQPFYAEKLVHLPHCYMPSDTGREIAERTPSRAACGLPPDGFVFCSFNNSYKINPTMFDVWMRLLHGLPGSVLWLLEFTDLVRDNLRREAAARDISPERLVFAPRVPLPDHRARHRLADLFLDTLPYNAHATANDALWAGLPLLTCVGETFPGRVAGSLLQAAGLPELITRSLAEYEAAALKLAEQPERLGGLRRRLERSRASLPLFDMARYTRDIEAAYTQMWESWRRGSG